SRAAELSRRAPPRDDAPTGNAGAAATVRWISASAAFFPLQETAAYHQRIGSARQQSRLAATAGVATMNLGVVSGGQVMVYDRGHFMVSSTHAMHSSKVWRD